MDIDKTSSRSTAQHSRSSSENDAIALLTKDHAVALEGFKQYEKLGDKALAAKQKLAQQLCEDLTIHMRIEEEIFYPAVREALGDDDMMDEAEVEHDAARNLIGEIEDMAASESHYDAKVKVLGEEVQHHVKEEQDEMFAKVRDAKLDLDALGSQMAERKLELKAEFSGE